METLFDIKSKMPYDLAVFENMKKTAVELLCSTNKDKYTQAIVLYSTTGNEYSDIINNACSKDKAEEKVLLEKLKLAEDTKMRYVLCMWQDNNIDVPSFALRKMLCELDPKNQEALSFVMTTDGVSAIKISSTMK